AQQRMRGTVVSERRSSAGLLADVVVRTSAYSQRMKDGAAGEAAAARTGTFAPPGGGDFRGRWGGRWGSSLPFFMSNVVQSVVAFEISGRNRAVGTVAFAQGAAMLALAPL